MSANTNNTSDYDEDVNAQETEAVRAAATAAENEVFLRDTLGIHLPADNIQSADIAEKVAHRVTLIVDQTRNNIDRGQLENLLNRNIQNRVNTARVTPGEAGTLATATDTQRNRNIRAVAEAIRESIPTAALNDVLRYGLPAVIPEKEDTPLHHISLTCKIDGVDRDVLIDTRHSFWRENEYPGKKDLRNALRSQGSLASVGIRVTGTPPVPESYSLSKDDVKAILKAKSPVVDLNRRSDNISFNPPASPDVTLHVNTANLLRHRQTAGTQRLVASYAHPIQLRNAFTTDDNGIQNFIMTDPSDAEVTPAMWEELADEIFLQVRGSAGPGRPLAIEERGVAELQKEVAEQHRFHTTLREGSDNQAGAAFAASILMKYKDIRSVLQTGDQTKAKENLDKERARLLITKTAAEVSSITYSPVCSWAQAETRISDFSTVVASIHAGGALSMGTETMTISSPPSRTEINSATTWAANLKKDAEKVLAESQALANKLQVIAINCRAIDPACSLPITTLFNWGPPVTPEKTLFDKSINVVSLVDEVLKEDDLELTTEDEHKAKADDYKAEFEKIKNGTGPKGAEAQHLVIKEYLKRYHGLTDAEASSGANVIRGRTLIDTEMATAIAEITGDLHGDVDDDEATRDEQSGFLNRYRVRARRDLVRIAGVAKAARIPVGANNIPNWSAGSYKNLMGAYFALRQMNDGTDVPWMMRLSGSNSTKKQLREITRAILKTHAKAMLQEFGASVGLSDDKQKEILKDPTKAEHQAILIGILEGEVPDSQKAQVSKILDKANKNVFWKRRGVGYVAGSLLYGDKNPVSGKNLLYGNKYVSALGAAHGAKNVAVAGKNTVTGTVGGVWNNKATIAKIGVLTAIGGPLGLLIGGAVWGGDFGKGSNANSTLAA